MVNKEGKGEVLNKGRDGKKVRKREEKNERLKDKQKENE